MAPKRGFSSVKNDPTGLQTQVPKNRANPTPEGIKPTTEAYQQAIRELTNANLRLRQLDKAKDEFISIASHELRNPMAIIKGNISMILTGDAGELNIEIKDVLTDVMIAVERQIRLVNELLDISRIEAGVINFNLQPSIQMDQVAQLLVNSLKGIAGNQNTEIRVTDPEKPLPEVQADHDKISQVLINLVTNSMKFTKNGVIDIQTKQKGDYVHTCVTDNGLGIPKEQQDLLFKKFSKPSAPTPGTISAGSGLGLYISKKYVEKLGGDIWLERSEPRVGSTFCFSLPISTSDRAKQIAEEIKSLQPIKDVHLKG
ncbi:HAMP domain-containing histidine kinase [Patescibacteria group bacterium]|nr:HAMP domain-containing histidine kinase [Patescibacteria group bacterium]